jgi:XTP/dITP diphosphohydrolase
VELIVLATKNEGKAGELARLLVGIAKRFETLADHPRVAIPPEGDASYRQNALGKARAVAAVLGVPTIGDDSGLEVDALGGGPGTRSARYAGERAGDALNNERLLEALRGLPPDRRSARFRCVLALVRGADDETVVEGVCEGRIAEVPRGNRGFGYDPLFVPKGMHHTLAELPAEVKDSVSHRARAAVALRAALRTAPHRPVDGRRKL